LLICITPPGSQAILDTSLFIRSRNLTRTSGGNRRPDHDFPCFVRWYRESKLKLDELVTRLYALDQINQAVDDLEEGRILGRAIITYATPSRLLKDSGAGCSKDSEARRAKFDELRLIVRRNEPIERQPSIWFFFSRLLAF
jgi:hypothetical protein